MTRHDIVEFLDSLDIPYEWVDHPAVFTVAESASIIKDKFPVKNLLLQNKNGSRFFMVILPGNERLDLKSLARFIGESRLTFAREETMMQLLGVKPGSVSLFGLLHHGSSSIEVIIEKRLVSIERLGFHPNDNTATVFIPGRSIETVLQKTAHKHSIMTFP